MAVYESKKCGFCNIEFTPNRGNQRYCKETCLRQAKKSPVVSYYRKCAYCKEWFYPKHSTHFFCTEDCVKGKRTFSMKNINPHFEREYFLEKYDFTCQICNKRLPWDGLHCHHILPLSYGGEDTEDNLTILCVECHKAQHTPQEKERIKNAITA
jgi:hypothetical protein